MHSQTPVEIADRMSRKRAAVVAVAAAAFLIIQVIARPFFVGGSVAEHHMQREFWAINAVVLLLALATGGGLLNSKRLRSLVNDEVSHGNRKTAITAGFWVAMTIAMGLYVLPAFDALTGREAVYVIVSASLVVALFVFSYLEYRAHRDG